MELYTFNKLFTASIIKRPSKHIKSPYVADICLENTTTECLGHTPSLGCCGLSDKGEKVLVSKLGNTTKCDYRVELAIVKTKGFTIYVGISPKLAESIAQKALQNNLIQNLQVKTLNREKTIMNSRFDFLGKTVNDKYYICEVKTVPLADYADAEKKELTQMDFHNKKYNEKIAYFPDGYRKTKNRPISERAVKHVNELRKIKEINNDIRCILLFVVQRTDVKWFQPSRRDPIYLNALQNAWQSGVEIKCLQVKWNENGCCNYYTNDLPIMLYDDYNMSL